MDTISRVDFDLDAFEERSAIMEYDGGLSRFRAETEAARAQGVSRHEANSIRDYFRTRNIGQALSRDAAHNLPEVQQRQEKEIRSMFIGNVSAGWGCVALLALSVLGGGMV